MILFEQVTGKPFALDGTITSIVTFFWCVIEAHNEGTIGLSEFLGHLDEHPKDFDYLMGWFNREMGAADALAPKKKAKKAAKP
jgi:hypothetical protein